MMNEEYSFTVVNKEGVEVTCDVVSMMADKDSKIYLLYTDYFLDDKGNFRLLASELVENKSGFVLKDIEDREKLNELVNSAKKLYKKTTNNAEA